MSISQNIKKDKFTKRLKKIFEYINREINNRNKVYFPYKTDFIHPAFDKLKNNPPIKYCNKRDAILLHLAMGGSKRDMKRNHIIEVIDHAFSIIASYEIFPREPIEYFKRKNKIKYLYQNDKLKKIIFISNGQRELTRYYFPEKEIYEKSVVIPIPWENNITIGVNKKKKSVNFLFISSNYQTKGVEIVIKSWEKFKTIDITNSTLTLVSHDIPKEVEKKLQKDINLVKKIPLSNDLKNELYKNSDIVLSLTLTDGVTAIEAISYGKPIITFRTQHSKDFIDNDNGIEIDVPINVYDVEKYGIVWKTKKEFEDIVKEYISVGKFDVTIDELVKSFSKYSKNGDFLKKQTINAIEKYYKDHTIENRNKKLLEIYKRVKWYSKSGHLEKDNIIIKTFGGKYGKKE